MYYKIILNIIALSNIVITLLIIILRVALEFIKTNELSLQTCLADFGLFHKLRTFFNFLNIKVKRRDPSACLLWFIHLRRY